MTPGRNTAPSTSMITSAAAAGGAEAAALPNGSSGSSGATGEVIVEMRSHPPSATARSAAASAPSAIRSPIGTPQPPAGGGERSETCPKPGVRALDPGLRKQDAQPS